MKFLTDAQQAGLLQTLQERFTQNMHRHSGISWDSVRSKLLTSPEALVSLHKMEETGGQPDVVGYNEQTQSYLFFDCSPQSPEGRRSLCFDRQALESRKANKPQGSAQELAEEMGAQLLTPEEFAHLQTLGEFDTKTSSWVQTPENIRKLGGALFCDRRYNTTFVYHNGADSYYAARGFRCSLTV